MITLVSLKALISGKWRDIFVFLTLFPKASVLPAEHALGSAGPRQSPAYGAVKPTGVLPVLLVGSETGL